MQILNTGSSQIIKWSIGMKSNDNTKEYAWNSFSKTGKIGYYLFYKALTEYGETNGTEAARNTAKKNSIP